VILGSVLLVSLVFCCIAVFCLQDLYACLFGARGGSRVAPAFAQEQQQFLPAGGGFPGQYPGQYQSMHPLQPQFNGPYTAQHTAQY